MKYLKKNSSARYAGQKETVDSVRQIDRDLYVIECHYDYQLDALLQRGAASTGDLFAKVAVLLTAGDNDRDTYRFSVESFFGA